MEVNNIQIRDYHAGDREAVAHIYLESRRQTFYWLDTLEYTLADFDTDTHGEKIWVAELDGSIAGFIAVWEPDNFIHHLYVNPQLVGKGAGKALLTAATTYYPEPLKLKCLVKNERARLFYQSQGWIVAGEDIDANGAYLEMASR